MNIYSYLVRNNIRFGTKDALIFNDTKISYSKLLDIVDFYSKEFSDKYKLKPGNKISIFMDNSIEYILLILIACKLKITVQTLGTYYSKNLINSRIKKFKPKKIFTQKYLKSYISRNNKDIIIFEYDKVPNTSKKLKKKYFFLKQKYNSKLLAVKSSGTTGSSKTVIFSEKCKIQRSLSAIKSYKLSTKDIFIATAPFDHSVGHRQIFLPLILGSSNIILKNFHPKVWLKCVKKYKISFTLLISTQISKILETVKLNKKNISSLKNLVSVSTKLNQKDKIKLLKLKINLHEMYGTCEIGTATSINLKLLQKKSDSVGKACKNYKLKIIKNNKLCPNNEIGEILCYSPNLFEEYYQSKIKKKNIFYKKYFRTGDLGYLDKDGYLYYVGRLKNLVKINGMSVYPEEIEKKIKKNINIKNFVITGSASSFGDEKLSLFVEKLTKSRLIKLKKILNVKLEKYEIPQNIVNLEKLPRTNLGKINTSELKKMNFN